MTSSRIRNIQDAARWQLCVGCGACAFLCPQGNITLEDVPAYGIRPRVSADRCTGCGECLKACPGIEISHGPLNGRGMLTELRRGWGPVLEVWEGYASDPSLRFDGSSGGAASALALYGIERERMGGVLHVAADPEKPYANRTVVSRSRDEVLATTGSRYAPASPCDGLDRVLSGARPCVFIGKPCDVTAVRKAQSVRPELERSIGLAIGIFCAGTPSTQGTLDLLERLGIAPDALEELRYRGKGWPGKLSVRVRGEGRTRELLAYCDAWGFVQKYRPYRCYLCPDGTSEFADISCGDPWYRPPQEGEQGRSLVLVRTEQGRRFLQSAREAGYLTLEKGDPGILEASQKNLLRKRGAIWGRLIAMKAFGIPAPRLQGFDLFENWLSLPMQDKARSVLGTVRRIIQRGYYRPINDEHRKMLPRITGQGEQAPEGG